MQCDFKPPNNQIMNRHIIVRLIFFIGSFCLILFFSQFYFADRLAAVVDAMFYCFILMVAMIAYLLTEIFWLNKNGKIKQRNFNIIFSVCLIFVASFIVEKFIAG